jgi:hypothetical protein
MFFVHSKAFFYCLDLRLGVKDLFMHKKHSLYTLNIKMNNFSPKNTFVGNLGLLFVVKQIIF